MGTVVELLMVEVVERLLPLLLLLLPLLSAPGLCLNLTFRR